MNCFHLSATAFLKYKPGTRLLETAKCVSCLQATRAVTYLKFIIQVLDYYSLGGRVDLTHLTLPGSQPNLPIIQVQNFKNSNICPSPQNQKEMPKKYQSNATSFLILLHTLLDQICNICLIPHYISESLLEAQTAKQTTKRDCALQ